MEEIILSKINVYNIAGQIDMLSWLSNTTIATSSKAYNKQWKIFGTRMRRGGMDYTFE